MATRSSVLNVLYAGENAVEIDGGKFTWEAPERPALTE